MPFCHARLRAPGPKTAGYPLELRTIGDHIRKRRLDRGLLQKDVAERIGADQWTIINWEKRGMAPSARFIPAIIQFLGYDPSPPTRVKGGA